MLDIVPADKFFERNGQNLARTDLPFVYTRTQGILHAQIFEQKGAQVFDLIRSRSKLLTSAVPLLHRLYTLCKLRPFVKNAIPKLTPAKILRTLVNSTVLTEFARFCRKPSVPKFVPGPA